MLLAKLSSPLVLILLGEMFETLSDPGRVSAFTGAPAKVSPPVQLICETPHRVGW